MISRSLARALRDAGVRWTPLDGDRFALDADGLDDQVFTVSEMTIEEHRYETGSVLGFNGTTEWALDSVALEDALWLPAEHQLRDLLGGTFRSLSRVAAEDGSDATARWTVDVALPAGPQSFTAVDPSDAYAEALLTLVRAAAA
ncbi:pilus assembly protein CpaE [Luteimicrobium sp. DT211]|uniref:pilus assembly protein CpaE n=1 Tax=Luteimicrobium sp. DT211 TaxID=3393412 RepID=UPI003CECC057